LFQQSVLNSHPASKLLQLLGNKHYKKQTRKKKLSKWKANRKLLIRKWKVVKCFYNLIFEKIIKLTKNYQMLKKDVNKKSNFY